MGIASPRAKTIMSQPNPLSKTQQLKMEKSKDNLCTKIVCAKCGNGETTLYKNGRSYYCKNHMGVNK